MHRLLPALLAPALLLTACQGGSASRFPPRGAVMPTVAGRAPSAFCSLAEGRAAFTRCCGSLTATLEDASWLRLEGPPERVEADHRAYFEFGYTTFQVELRSKEFVQPTRECFLLEDSQGRRVSGSPVGYQGSPTLVDDRYFSTFELAFQHVITQDLEWIRLTRPLDGSSVEWTFGSCPAPEPCPPAARPAGM